MRSLWLVAIVLVLPSAAGAKFRCVMAHETLDARNGDSVSWHVTFVDPVGAPHLLGVKRELAKYPGWPAKLHWAADVGFNTRRDREVEIPGGILVHRCFVHQDGEIGQANVEARWLEANPMRMSERFRFEDAGGNQAECGYQATLRPRAAAPATVIYGPRVPPDVAQPVTLFLGVTARLELAFAPGRLALAGTELFRYRTEGNALLFEPHRLGENTTRIFDAKGALAATLSVAVIGKPKLTELSPQVIQAPPRKPATDRSFRYLRK